MGSMRQDFAGEVLAPAVRPSWRRILAALGVVAVVAAVAWLAGGVGMARAAGPLASSALVDAAQSQPDQTFRVIIQSSRGEHSDKLVQRVGKGLGRTLHLRGKDKKQWFDGLRDQFNSVDAVAVTFTGRDLLKVLRLDGLATVTLDAPVHLASVGNSQDWPGTVGATDYWATLQSGGAVGTVPAIAVIDSGVSPMNDDFGPRVIGSVDLAGSQPNTPNADGFGHGTMVAGLAAGSSATHAGVNPLANIVSVDVIDDTGRANTSDVIRACDWILANQAAYNIRVANLSLSAEGDSSFRWDPLDKAVERLWFSGITVVTAVGNYGVDTGPSGVHLAPANDPFVITVGASDTNGTVTPADDFAAPWSAWGYTNDGFAKPDLSAPGRYMIAPIPGPQSTLGAAGGQNPALVPTGYIQLSGTSFAAPVVAGAAAALIMAHPDWTPDQVKGALMVGASSLAANTAWQLGVGEISLMDSLHVTSPPNPNGALNRFVGPDPAGGSLPVFDEASWASTASADASWASASWASASWASASWASASWASASWASASWASASWSSASWASTAYVSASWSDNASADTSAPTGYDTSATGQGTP